MTAPIKIWQYINFIEPRKFDTADIKFTVDWLPATELPVSVAGFGGH